MTTPVTRRRFMHEAAAGVTGLSLAPLAFAADAREVKKEGPKAPLNLTVISGKPRERGRMYGQKFKDGIHTFLDREIYRFFTGKPSTREQMLRYADACGKAVRGYAPVIHDEMEGIAEGAGLKFEEVVLITCHEELWHKAVLPQIDHCTAVAIGPPDTKDGRTYVGQTWDWMATVAGMSSMLLWKRADGPSLLAYAFPGLWCGAGLNSAGIALCWTSASDKEKKIPGPRVGIPSYVLLTHFLYQETLRDVIAEAKRANHAGWFTFVLADANGNLLNLEGSPKELAVEEHKGRLTRVGYGSRQMTRAREGEKPQSHPRAQLTYDLLGKAKGQFAGQNMQELFGNPKAGICVKGTIDMMVYDCSARTAYVSRGPGYGPTWRTFTFDGKEG